MPAQQIAAGVFVNLGAPARCWRMRFDGVDVDGIAPPASAAYESLPVVLASTNRSGSNDAASGKVVF
jgi:hypothetical protein